MGVETQWLDPSEREAWLRLVAVAELLPGVLDHQLRSESGLTHFEYLVLAIRGLVERFPCPEDGRATNARLTGAGWDTVVAAAPGHVDTVRRSVLDPLTPEQVGQLKEIGDALLTRLDPDGRMTVLYDPERAE